MRYASSGASLAAASRKRLRFALARKRDCVSIREVVEGLPDVGKCPTLGNYGHEKARVAMLAIKAQCDGQEIVLPRTEKFQVGQVIVVFGR